MTDTCPNCNSQGLRTFSFFNNEKDRWEWWKGCNNCDWQSRDESEESSIQNIIQEWLAVQQK